MWVVTRLMSRPRELRRLTCVLGLVAGAVALTGVVVGEARAPAVQAPTNVISAPGSRVGASDVAFDPGSANGLVVWTDDDGSGILRVFARRIDADGRPVGESTQLSTANNNPQVPQATFNAKTREYLVLWTAQADPTGRQALLVGRRLTAAGVPLGNGEFAVGGPIGADGESPQLVASGRDGRYLVAFRSTAGRINSRLLDRAGGLIAEHRVSRRRGDCGRPTVSYRARVGEYLIGWACGLPGDTGQAPQTQYVQRISARGREVGRDIPVITPRVSRFGSGETALAYDSSTDHFLFVGQARERIRTRLLAGGGKPIGRVRTLRRLSYPLEAGGPSVAFDSRRDRYVVVWQAYRRGLPPTAPDASSFFATSVDRRGVESGRSVVVLSRAPAREVFPFTSVIARGRSGGVLVTFSGTTGVTVRTVSP